MPFSEFPEKNGGFPSTAHGIDVRGSQQGRTWPVAHDEQVAGAPRRNETRLAVTEYFFNPVVPASQVPQSVQRAAGQKIDVRRVLQRFILGRERADH